MKKLLNKIDMKQTVEEVAREAAEDCYECHYDDSLEMRLVKEAFRQGAEWQSKQSPWISVKEQLPEPNCCFPDVSSEFHVAFLSFPTRRIHFG